MEQLKEYLDKIPFTLFYLLWAAWLGWDVYQFQTSQDSSLAAKHLELTNAEKTVQKLQDRKKKLADFKNNLEKERQDLQVITEKFSASQGTLSADVNQDEFLKMVNIEARRLNLTVTALKPGGKMEQELYFEQSFDVSFKGLYVSVLGFLDRMANLKNIVRVESIDFRPSKVITLGDAADFIELNGSVQLKTFAYKPAKSDTTKPKGDSAPQAPTNPQQAGGKGA